MEQRVLEAFDQPLVSVVPRVRVVVVAATLFVLTLGWRVLTFAGFQNDHYVHLARAQQMLLGDWPVRDFVDPGMPLMYVLSAAAWWLWGGSPGTELLLVAAAFAVGAICTLVVAYRLSGSILIATAAATLEALIFPRTYSYPKVLLYAAGAWAILSFAHRPSRQRLVLLAGVIAVAFLFRHDHGLYIGVAAATAVALATVRHGWQLSARQLAVLTGGAGLFILPWLAFVSYQQGLIDYFSSGLEFSRAEARMSAMESLPRFHLSSTEGLVTLRPAYRPSAVVEWNADTPEALRRELERRYGLEPVTASDTARWEYYGRGMSPTVMRALANDPHVSDVSGFDRIVEWSWWDALLARLSPRRPEKGPGLHLDENAYVWLFYVFHALPIICAIFLWRRRGTGGNRWTGESATVGGLIVMGVLVNIGMIRGNLPVWLPDAIVPAVLLGAWLAPLVWSEPWNRRSTRVAARIVLVAGVVLTAAAVSSVGNVREQMDRGDMRRGAEAVRARAADLAARLRGRHRDAGFTPSGVSEALLPFFDYLARCSSPDDRLLMTHLYPDVYVLGERGFAGGHVAFLEGFYASEAEQRRTLDRLRRESVPFVLLIADREATFRSSFPILSDHLDHRYQPMTDIPLEQTAAVRVLLDKQTGWDGRDAQTGWPCAT